MKPISLFARSIILYLLFFPVQIHSQEYTLDKGHTYVGFNVERFLVGEVVGRFNDFDASIGINEEDLSSLQMSATINVNSLDSNNATRDGHLKGTMWLDAENYPEIKFVAKEVTKAEEGYQMVGDLTIKGVTQTVDFPIEILGPFKDPTQKTALAIKGDLSISRFDYGITFNKKMDNGHLFIGEAVEINFRVLAYQE